MNLGKIASNCFKIDEHEQYKSLDWENKRKLEKTRENKGKQEKTRENKRKLEKKRENKRKLEKTREKKQEKTREIFLFTMYFLIIFFAKK